MELLKLDEIFDLHGVGIVTGRDKLTIAISKADIYDRVVRFLEVDEITARIHFDVGDDSRDWQLQQARLDVFNSKMDWRKVVPIAYRPFDIRYTYYTGNSRGFLCMPRSDIMKHMFQPNMGLAVIKKTNKVGFSHCIVTGTIIESRLISVQRGISYLFPLYLYPNAAIVKQDRGLLEPQKNVDKKKPNINKNIFKLFKQHDMINLERQPQKLFYYIYGILNSPLYRERYSGQLAKDFPCIPMTVEKSFFSKMSLLGEKLVSLHLMKSAELDRLTANFSFNGHPLIHRVNYIPGHQELTCRPKGFVYINNRQYFYGIPRGIWEMEICGRQVMKRWLDLRKGRVLSGNDILHYLKMAKSLELTLDCQQQADVLFREIEKK